MFLIIIIHTEPPCACDTKYCDVRNVLDRRYIEKMYVWDILANLIVAIFIGAMLRNCLARGGPHPFCDNLPLTVVQGLRSMRFTLKIEFVQCDKLQYNLENCS